MFEATHDGKPIPGAVSSPVSPTSNTSPRSAQDFQAAADEADIDRLLQEDRELGGLVEEAGLDELKIRPCAGFTFRQLGTFAKPLRNALLGFNREFDFHFDVLTQTARDQFVRDGDAAKYEQWSIRASAFGLVPRFRDFPMFEATWRTMDDDARAAAYAYLAAQPQRRLTICERALVDWGDRVADVAPERRERFETDRAALAEK